MTRFVRQLLPLLLCGGIAFGAGIFTGIRRGVPFVLEKRQWTIGIYRGDTPFRYDPGQNRRNPVITAEDVTDVPASFVADPFLVQKDSVWYLIFEVYNLSTKQGDLAVASSADTKVWQYERVVLDEPFHLSYPYVFEWQGAHYLIPESFEAGAVRLYRADDFPWKWSFVANLVEGADLVDPSIVRFADRWWMFVGMTDNATLRLYWADELFGPWQEHPLSPIVQGDRNIARPGGRVMIHEGRPVRLTQDSEPHYGNQMWAFEVTEITPTTYAERLLQEAPVLEGSGKGWNARAMHQLDPQPLPDGRWIAAVDGFGTYRVYGWKY